MAPRLVHLILDFDGTLTTTSTLPLIYNIGHRLNPSAPSWQSISQAYMDDYNVHLSCYPLASSRRKSLSEELAWLQSLRDVERKSTERVEAAGVFRGVTKTHVDSAARKAVREGDVAMRRGWQRIVESVMMSKGKVAVVSVGWSGDFIRGCLRTAYEQSYEGGGKGARIPSKIDDVDICANEILGGQEGKMTRHFPESSMAGDGGIWTAKDKEMVMAEVLSKCAQGSEAKVVYVGDSPTDLACLLGADVGICIRNEGSTTAEQKLLDMTLNRIGVKSEWIGVMRLDGLEGKLRRNDTQIQEEHGKLWWAKDFEEIGQSVLFSANTDSKDGRIRLGQPLMIYLRENGYKTNREDRRFIQTGNDADGTLYMLDGTSMKSELLSRPESSLV
ncbi:MAG: hypothetical protein Q9186_000583 [Xanthomendoza sp. 1 TL-2023]